MSGIIGGDEVGAIVLDFGGYTTRAGYAGQDLPMCDLPSCVGVLEQLVDKQDAMDDGFSEPLKQNKYFIDTVNIKSPRKHMNLQSFIKDGQIEDFDLFEKVLEYVIQKQLRCDLTLHPVLMSEAVTNTRAKREKISEILFEKYKIPGFYIAKNAVLSAFACNRTSGVVLDCGSSHTTAVPIHDGFVLHKAVAQTSLGGDFIIAQCKQLLDEQIKDELVPYYMVKSKETVKQNEPSRYIRRDTSDLTDSYKRFMLKETLLDFSTHVLQVSDTQYNHSEISLLPRVSYEFPNGFNTDFGEERYRIAETLFQPSLVKSVQPNSMLDMVHLITSSVGMCDPELRPGFFSNVMVVGGNSLLIGFIDRLSHELNNLNYKTKVFAMPTAAERRFSSWIGGSILGSLGTFHQMWISKQEYEETGKQVVEMKCRM